ncbi:MAG: DUF4331 domain-containing protein, partial [Sphingomonas sp.]|nr:DUF4331 domain-containing protein [Sphingomonas sp.]
MLRSGVKLMAGVALLVTAVTPVWSSSHREAPNITEKPKVDNTDVYAFRSYEPGRAGFVTLITHFQPFQEPGGGPNYFTMDEDALYEIMVDSNGDAVEDVTFQFDFNNLLRGGVGRTIVAGGKNLPIPLRFDGQVTEVNDLNLGEFETYTVTQVRGDRRTGTRSRVTSTAGTLFKPLDNVGNKTIPNYATYSDKFIYDVSIPGCSGGGKVFVGQREENFAVNLGPIFDLVNFIPIQGDNDPVFGNGQPFPGGITQSILNSELVENPGDQPRGYGYNVTSLAIEVPISCLTGNGNGVIGVWSTASMPQSRIL